MNLNKLYLNSTSLFYVPIKLPLLNKGKKLKIQLKTLPRHVD